MRRLPAIAAFANVALQAVALLMFVLATAAAGMELAESWRPSLMLHSWPIPLVTVLALVGLVAHPATKRCRVRIWGGSVLLAISAWMLSLVSAVLLSVLQGDSEPEGIIAELLAPFAFALGGLGALIIGDKLFKPADELIWFTGLGVCASLCGLATYVSFPAIYLAWLSMIAWWLWLGVLLSKHQET